MTVTLNIENDDHLRAYIKDCIKGQVLAITREEFLHIVRDEIGRKVKGDVSNSRFEQMLKDALRLAVADMLREEHNVSEWRDEFVEPMVNNRVDHILSKRNFDVIVDRAVDAKITAMAKSIGKENS